MTSETRDCIVLVDDLELRRSSIAALLQPWCASIDASIVAISTENMRAGLPGGLNPILVILSIGGTSLRAISMPDVTASIHQALPHVPCLVLSDHTEPEEAVLAARMGEQAFLPTTADPRVAVRAMALVASGGTYFPREALLQVWEHHQRAPRYTPTGDDGLTRRQLQVLQQLRLGSPNKTIARELSMQETTVKQHVREIMRKLGARNRTEAALRGRQKEFDDTSSPAVAPVSAAVVSIKAASSPRTRKRVRAEGGL